MRTPKRILIDIKGVPDGDIQELKFWLESVAGEGCEVDDVTFGRETIILAGFHALIDALKIMYHLERNFWKWWDEPQAL